MRDECSQRLSNQFSPRNYLNNLESIGKQISVFCGVSILSACAITPQPITVSDSYSEAKKNIKHMFATEGLHITLNYEEALARGIQYNYDYRIKLVNTALQAGELKLAEMTMFPDIKNTASLYSRANDYATFSITSGGSATDVLSSTPRTLKSMRSGLTWNILDFGMSYIRAKQQGERVLIAEEESRKQLQLLAQDIRIAYWKAYSAQALLTDMRALQKILDETEENINKAIKDQLIPKEDILKYRNALLGGRRQFVQLREKFDKAQIDLKRLINVPLSSKVELQPPPLSIARVQDIEKLNFKKLDTIALVLRPELRSQHYMERIAKLGVKAAILQVFPGLTLNKGFNYNSNKFLLNNSWVDESLDLSWGLLNLVSLPASLHSANTQIEYEKMKSMALTLAVLTQTRYAFSKYANLAKEFKIAEKQTKNAQAIYKLTLNRNIAAMASKQQVVYSKLQYMITKMDRDLVLADLSTALGELYLSSGFDVLPVGAYDSSSKQTIKAIHDNLNMQASMNFVEYVDFMYAKLTQEFPEKNEIFKGMNETGNFAENNEIKNIEIERRIFSDEGKKQIARIKKKMYDALQVADAAEKINLGLDPDISDRPPVAVKRVAKAAPKNSMKEYFQFEGLCSVANNAGSSVNDMMRNNRIHLRFEELPSKVPENQLASAEPVVKQELTRDVVDQHAPEHEEQVSTKVAERVEQQPAARKPTTVVKKEMEHEELVEKVVAEARKILLAEKQGKEKTHDVRKDTHDQEYIKYGMCSNSNSSHESVNNMMRKNKIYIHL